MGSIMMPASLLVYEESPFYAERKHGVYYSRLHLSAYKESTKGGDRIGRMLVVEFNESDSGVFDKVMEVLQGSKSFETLQVKNGNTISLPGLTIHLNQRKIYRDRQEIPLTTKEYELLCLLAANRGQVLTYTQIYEKVWGSTFSGNEKVIRYHLYNLRKKINTGSADTFYVIRCVREVGYCFELESNKTITV